MGDDVMLGLAVERVGRSSLTLDLHCRAGAQERMRSRQVLVTTDLDTHQARALPDDMRAALARLPQA
ncbi:hypothetical protein D3C72_2135940 [compost metagenome]